MGIWYVTTGISLSTDSRCWTFEDSVLSPTKLEELDRQSTRQILDTSDDPLDTLETFQHRRRDLLGCLQNETNRAETAGKIARQDFRRECWSRDRLRALPAELATLWHLQQQIHQDDTVTFIAGQSNLVEATLLAALLRNIKCDKSPCFPDVQVLGPFELDPDESERFQGSIDELWRRLSSNGMQQVNGLVMTGGYKGLILALTLKMCLEGWSIPIYYLHETASEGAICIQARGTQNGETGIQSHITTMSGR